MFSVGDEKLIWKPNLYLKTVIDSCRTAEISKELMLLMSANKHHNALAVGTSSALTST